VGNVSDWSRMTDRRKVTERRAWPRAIVRWVGNLQVLAGVTAGIWLCRPHRWSATDTILFAATVLVLLGGTVVGFAAERAEAASERAAHHDPLTGLANRRVLARRTTEALQNRHQRGGDVAMFLIDLDRFKLLNDTHGHLAGDQLLCGLTRRLIDRLPDAATVCRLGGDEFAVVLSQSSGSFDAMEVAALIATSWEEPIQIDRGPVRTSGSIGVAIAGDQDDATSLLRNADAAMYRAKAEGRSGIALYDERERAVLARRLALEQGLFEAVGNHELTVVFQPIVDLETRSVHAAEALLRWQHPTLGIISPEEFIPLAEESAMIEALGIWVLDESLRQLARWRANGLVRSDFAVHVNVSGAQLHAGFPERVDDLLIKNGVEPSALMVELTESVLMRVGTDGTDVLRALTHLGVRLALDDFGTGFSSLSYLHQTKVHTMKIDRSFVARMADDATCRAIVQSVVSLGRSLGLQVIAEGVDSPDKQDQLMSMGCHLAQGYLISQPLIAAVMADFLRAEPARHLDLR
jgi:diguanylate cyclase (GGDEF)-like protein